MLLFICNLLRNNLQKQDTNMRMLFLWRSELPQLSGGLAQVNVTGVLACSLVRESTVKEIVDEFVESLLGHFNVFIRFQILMTKLQN